MAEPEAASPDALQFGVHSKSAIHLASFLGGPLAASYLLFENFRAFRDDKNARLSLTVGIAVTAAMMVLLIALPVQTVDALPKQLIPFLTVFAEYLVVKNYQAAKIDSHFASGGRRYTLWRAAGTGLAGLVLTAAPISLLLHDDSVLPPGKLITFGKIQNSVYYDSTTISFDQAQLLGLQLTSITFFNEEQQNCVSLTRSTDTIVIAVPTVDGAWNNPDAMGYFTAVQDTLQSLNPQAKIVINLTYPGFSAVKRTVGDRYSTYRYF